MTIRAAGVMLVTARDGRALFLKRGPDGDAPGLWCFPGGKIESGETAEQAAEREVREEIGPAPYGAMVEWTRRIGNAEVAGPANAIVAPAEIVDFTTFIAKTDKEFVPTLNDEHTGWQWASVNDPPEPLHPGARIALARLTMDELGVARAMAAGELTSPQRYGDMWLFSIRITGTGLAFRGAVKDGAGKIIRDEEYCWREPANYLGPDFLARCNGLPVVLGHPKKKPRLDDKEFNDRVIGTVFVPFLKGDEVWGVAKIYDEAAAGLMLSEQISTSPAVIFSEAIDANQKLKLSDGTNLLIEGRPALLDHIAVVMRGVWDKGQSPAGVLNDALSQEPIGMTEEEKAVADKARKDADDKLTKIADALARMDARLDSMEREDKARKDAEEKERKDRARHDTARKDRFGARKDGESYKDWKGRHDADEMAMRDALRKDGDEEEVAKKAAKDARRDAEEAEKRMDAESFEKWAKEEEDEDAHKDKARKDAEEKERMDTAEKARLDAAVAENADLKTRLAAVEGLLKGITAEAPASERDALAAAQSRADSVAAMFGDRASPPIPGETPLAYRKRLLVRFQSHSAKFKESRFDGLDSAMLGPIEDIVYADAVASARSPSEGHVGRLIEFTELDRAGRTITKYHGDIAAWMAPFMTGATVGRIIRNPKGA